MLRRILVTFIILSILMPVATGRSQTRDEAVSAVIKEKLGGEKVVEQLEVGTCQISSLSIMPELYRRRNYRPVWTKADAVDQLLQAVRETYDDGLDPKDYHLDEILQQHSAIKAGTTQDPSLEASRDLILTDSFIRLTNHSICGKEDPLTFHPQWNLDKDRKINEAEALLLLEKAINGQSLAQTINGWKIRHPLYSRLKKALADYRAIKAKGGWKAVPAGRVLKKGMIDPRVQDLRARLADTDGLLETKTDPMTFDSSLAQALMGFQKRHALIADGVMRKGTYEALNVPVEDRIDQIRVNLERARWVLHDPGDTNVFVDIAGYRVFFERDNKIIWSCKAQVGQPYRNTPVFRSVITNIELNPSWVVPPSILIKDVLPAVKKDPSYLRKKHLMVIDERNHEVNPKSINWSLYPDRDFPYRLKQNPGPENSLGQIKINFPNEYLVYMHDTPHKELFAEEVRTFSSGCIRLEKPFELAELLLNDHSKWNLQSIMEAAKPGKTRIINLSTPVTIILFYWTVEVDDNGVVYFSSDPYQRDKAVLDGLGRDADIVKP